MEPKQVGEGWIKAGSCSIELGMKSSCCLIQAMLSPNCFWMMGDERLADLGALLVFRHWLRQQLEELTAEGDATVAQRQRGISEVSHSRLFF